MALSHVLVQGEQIANISDFLADLTSALESAEKEPTEKTISRDDLLGNMKQTFKASYIGY